MIITAPLRVPVSKKKWFVLNINQYRNTHFHVLNKSKIAYKNSIKSQLQQLPKLNRISVEYLLFPKDKRLCDLSNVTSIHSKYFLDSLVELGIIADDNYTIVIKETSKFGAIDRDNPRMEIRIHEESA